MKILLTGVTGYIGRRLLPELLQKGHHVVCCTRDRSRFRTPFAGNGQITVIEVDLTDEKTFDAIPADIDVAYYLVHSMADTDKYEELELMSAKNFVKAMLKTRVRQVIYLSGIVNEDKLSKHLLSRKNVEDELKGGSYHFTCIRAGIIVGSGSASFEIIRDLVEKLPVMIAPKWLLTRCQPIGVSDVIAVLSGVLMNEKTFDKSFDIGSEDILTYKEMLLVYARVRKLKRRIWIVPVMTPKLSSYWLYFVTSTSYKLATALVASMKVEVVCRNNDLLKILGLKPISYEESIRRAFDKVENNEILSSWKDAYSSSGGRDHLSKHISVPEFGCFKDSRTREIVNRQECLDKIWSIGGETGWYSANWMWEFRGFMDKLAGGVGLRRGRRNKTELAAGDALDFWRVIYADKQEGRLLLFAEMKLPGEAWLEFRIINNKLTQTATFRPLGLAGRLYWFLVLPFHGIIFSGMIKALTSSVKN